MAVLSRSRLGQAWLLVAVTTGVITPGYPLALHAAGFTKAQIAVFFALNSVAAFVFSVVAVRQLRRASRRGVLPALLLGSAAGLVLAASGSDRATVHVGGVLSMLFVAAMPVTVRAIQTSGLAASTDDAALSARVRSLSVLGYVLGVALYGVAVALPGPLDPVLLGAAATASAAVLTWTVRAPGEAADHALKPAPGDRDPATRPDPTTRPDPVGRGGTGRRAVVLGLAVVGLALVLLKGADSLRLVYLPLHVVSGGHAGSWVSALLVVTAVTELVVLRRVATTVPGGSARPVLVVAALLAAASFAASATWGGVVVLVLSQVVYAGFAALFQALGPVLLGRWLPSGLAGGVGVFGAVLQVGALVGVLAPLLVPGYGAAVFWLATVPCVVAALLLVALRQLDEPARETATAPSGGSPTSATGRGA
ncbi:hypothetical protein [Cellulosimicrobium sp. Marseille-Q8652]